MDGSLQSAQIVIPFVLEKLKSANTSFVEFGCGVGAWLFAIKSHIMKGGNIDVLGLDFDEPARKQLKSIRKNIEK